MKLEERWPANSFGPLIFLYTAISRKVVGKKHATIPTGIVGGLSSFFFKEIWKNCRRDYGHMFASAKGKQQK